MSAAAFRARIHASGAGSNTAIAARLLASRLRAASRARSRRACRSSSRRRASSPFAAQQSRIAARCASAPATCPALSAASSSARPRPTAASGVVRHRRRCGPTSSSSPPPSAPPASAINAASWRSPSIARLRLETSWRISGAPGLPGAERRSRIVAAAPPSSMPSTGATRDAKRPAYVDGDGDGGGGGGTEGGDRRRRATFSGLLAHRVAAVDVVKVVGPRARDESGACCRRWWARRREGAWVGPYARCVTAREAAARIAPCTKPSCYFCFWRRKGENGGVLLERRAYTHGCPERASTGAESVATLVKDDQ
eukprot:Rhum_TRINITY_DN14576_c5_g1::Rhum_TRINITY_DN14576_c5_g1_i4::g.93937::m.93937